MEGPLISEICVIAMSGSQPAKMTFYSSQPQPEKGGVPLSLPKALQFRTGDKNARPWR
jgi:hypothetical protein